MTIKLGVIGMSEGNGHPYSWSAIFNGYNPSVMEDCGFPVIPRYLAQQKWPEDTIKEAEVVSVWTQDAELSSHIAEASRISHVARTLEEMAVEVDAVLLARDDAENHYRFAESFILAGMPIYIDKPIALSTLAFERLHQIEQYPGQIFTCSALRYSPELSVSDSVMAELGEIREIVAFTPKCWSKYAVHIIEPVLKLLPAGDMPINIDSCGRSQSDDGSGCLSVYWQSGIHTSFYAMGAAQTNISIRIHGTHGWKELVFTDSFIAFKAALQDFVDGILSRTVRSTKEFNSRVVQLLEEGIK
ncbi:MAG: Gfo/Idh/MocA family oxidoreductase [Methylophaga sp.]